MTNQKQNDEPPLIQSRLFAIAVVALMLLIALWLSKEPVEPKIDIHWDGLYLEAKNEPIEYLQISGDYLLSQAPPFLVEGITLVTLINDDLITRIIWCESKGDPTAKNPKSTAYGLCQFLDGTWKYVQEKWDMKLDRYSYYDQLYACERLLKEEGLSHWESVWECIDYYREK